MKLTIFDKNNSGTTSARTGVRSVYINRKTGNISFSNTLKKGKGITVEQTVYFAKDEDSKTGDWYICFNAGENGLALSEKPVMIDGKEWFKIVLSKPLRVN